MITLDDYFTYDNSWIVRKYEPQNDLPWMQGLLMQINIFFYLKAKVAVMHSWVQWFLNVLALNWILNKLIRLLLFYV